MAQLKIKYVVVSIEALTYGKDFLNVASLESPDLRAMRING
jgi:hypothetical protein